MISVGEIWDQRFSEHAWPTEPDPFLVELAAPLQPGRCLDLASGPGRNSLWLASNGWEVTALDASEVALSQATKRASEVGAHIETLHADVVEWQPAQADYDLVVVANLHLSLVALTAVLAVAAQALVPGGHLFVVGHDLDNLGRNGPLDPDRLFTVERLARALPPTVSVEKLERRTRTLHDAVEQDVTGPDVAVLAWATRYP